MFLSDANADTKCLRQGDILGGILFPLLAAESIMFLGSRLQWRPDTVFDIESREITHRNAPAWHCQVLTRIGFAAVISQCCDLEPRNGRIAQPTIALARLVDVPTSALKDSARFESLSANKYPLNPDDPGYLNYFFVPRQAKLVDRDWVIDYGQVTSIPSSEFPAILAQKVLQMSDDSRIRFKIKLAASYGRITAEEEGSGHPWLTEPASDSAPQ